MRTVVIHSGGLDSTVLLYHFRDRGHQVQALSVDYGQRHRKELDQARLLCEEISVPHQVADLRAVQPLLAGSALTSAEIAVPDGHYAEDSMKATVVPNRNMILLALAMGWAVSESCDAVAFAAHGGDHTIYPDCRPPFIAAMQQAAQLCDWHSLELLAPFQTWVKSDIVRRGHHLQVPFARTWSCYKGGEIHCGTCGTCTERKEAFAEAQVPDPTEYAHV